MTRSRAFVFAVTFASLAATMSLAGAASAQGPSAPPPGYVAAPPPVDTAAAANAEENYKHVTIQANPLSAIIGRYGVDVAYLPALHHGIVLNPFYSHVSVDATSGAGVTTSAWSLSGFGGELGYRFYTGERGANGFYVGPSFLFSSYKQSVSGGDSLSFTNMGGLLEGEDWAYLLEQARLISLTAACGTLLATGALPALPVALLFAWFALSSGWLYLLLKRPARR